MPDTDISILSPQPSIVSNIRSPLVIRADFELAYHLLFSQLERAEVSAAQRTALVPLLLEHLSATAARPVAHAASKVKLYDAAGKT